MAATILAGLALASLTACGTQDDRKYDISPIFPLSPNKCEKYDGKSDGPGGACWVTKSECEKAASDWRKAMQDSPDAIRFTC
ncbi:hypothetical protein [Cryptosporangium phraense]|uniref:DUF3551 domain-containing protein n=1 Tax=Cryptosporangium phraense TaxID=2593070 RepID=A0A545AQ87_9ACTN|nr:hypothetical protein [Cryptosporangium phraense]TQS43440.1 hypothetical protein FL583_19610 [Cryptosporangium phraense]